MEKLNGCYFNMSEKEYRGINRENSSSIKSFLISPMNYYNNFVFKSSEDRQDSDSLIIGTMVDLELTCANHQEEIEKLYALESYSKPSGQWGVYVDNCIKEIKKYMDGNLIKKDLSDIIEYAFLITAYSDDKRISLRLGKKEISYTESVKILKENGGWDYILQFIKTKGKTPYNSTHIKAADACVSLLKTDSSTKDYFGYNPEIANKEIETYTQLVILFPYRDILFKSKIDKIFIDHKNKIISIVDLKTSSSISNFRYSYYKYKYFIQAALYTEAVKWAIDNTEVFSKFKDYKISPLFKEQKYLDTNSYPFQLIVAGYEFQEPPLKLFLSEAEIERGLKGYFDNYNNYHPGILYFCENIVWHKKNNVWNTTKNLYNNNNIELL